MIKSDKNMTINRARALLFVLCLPGTQAGAADTNAVDTSAWACEYCLVEQGYSGEIEAGVGNVTDDSFKFGEYNGLEDDGPFLIGNATARYREETGEYLDLHIRDLGLDTRLVDIEGGRQGSYSLFLNYDGIPHQDSDSAGTPYRGNGGDTLGLPAGWVPAGTTAGMTGLAASLRDVELETLRKRLGVGATFIPATHWETAVKARHEIRDGQKRSAGAIFFNSAQLAEPVDYVTDEVEASASYTTRKSQSTLSYYGSFFSNGDTSLTWENAYNPISPGAVAGRRALPPDNSFHQFLLSSGYQWSDRTRVSGDIAVGRMEQNENLLAATINPLLAVALPRQSADARVDTVTANLRVNSAVTDKLRLNAAYRYNDRDNKTPSTSFEWVKTDFSPGLARRNLPYSFTDQTVNLGGDYRYDRHIKLSAGYEYEKKERTNQEVDETTENTGWGKVSLRAGDNFDVAIKAAHSERDASKYHPVPEVLSAENPLLTKYNLADRSRDSGSIQAGFTPHERVSLGLGFDMSRDDYSKSLLGLTSSREYSINADASMLLTEGTTVHVFAGQQKLKSKQAGSQAFATEDWSAKNEDTINSYGIGVKHQLIKDKLDVGADYVRSRSTGEISVDVGAPGGDFPDLVSDLDTLKLYGNYHLKDTLTLRAAYWYEDYSSKDWMLDGVNPATIANLISFGEDSPDYTVHAVMLSIRYGF